MSYNKAMSDTSLSEKKKILKQDIKNITTRMKEANYYNMEHHYQYLWECRADMHRELREVEEALASLPK